MAEMTVQEAAEWGKTLDFPTVWTALTKLGEQVDQTTKTIDKLGEKVDRVTANVGGLNQSMGDLVETLFAPHLNEKFDAYNYNLKRIFNRVPIYDNNNRLRTDIDILLSNTSICMA
ncbi:hypothetical protein, partial [Treponema sp. R8-4-B8]